MLVLPAVLLVLLSSVLHLGWNVFLKGQDGSLETTWWINAGAAVTSVIGALGYSLVKGNEGTTIHALQSVYPLIIASMFAHATYFTALALSYRHANLSWTYPLARGLAILLTLLITASFWGIQFTPMVILGMVVMVGGLVILNLRVNVSRFAIWTTIVVGMMITAYTVIDSRAVLQISPLVYLACVFTGETILLSPWALRQRTLSRRLRAKAALAGAVSYVSYLLMLYAFQMAPAATALAFRQVAPALAPAVGSVWLKERTGWRIYLGAGLIALSAALLVI